MHSLGKRARSNPSWVRIPPPPPSGFGNFGLLPVFRFILRFRTIYMPQPGQSAGKVNYGFLSKLYPFWKVFEFILLTLSNDCFHPTGLSGRHRTSPVFPISITFLEAFLAIGKTSNFPSTMLSLVVHMGTQMILIEYGQTSSQFRYLLLPILSSGKGISLTSPVCRRYCPIG